LWCSPSDAAICFIIAQSGGQGLHGVAAARAGAPAITSMIAARKAAKTDNLGSEHPPEPKMSVDPPRRKVARPTDAARTR
jgi:hypothetical protein